MMRQDVLHGAWRLWLGAGLFAASLAWLAAVTPPLVAIACVLGGGVGLLLFCRTRSRFSLVILTLLMLAIAGCALFGIVMLRDFALLPVAVAQILAVLLLEAREPPNWVDEALDTPRSEARPRKLAHR